MDGLKIKTYKVISSGKYSVGIERNLKFNKLDIEKYKEKFNTLRKRKVIIEGNFSDNKWVFLGRERKAYFNFNNDIDENIKLAIKMYLLINIYDEGINPRTMLLHFYAIRYLLKHTKNLSLDKYENFQGELHKIRDTYIKECIVVYSYKFLRFFNSSKYKRYMEFLDKLKKKCKAYQPRRLPSFNSIIFFDDILQEFSLNCSRWQKEKYFPILLWWNITRSIPMRPIELSELEVNCIKKIDDIYIMRILKCHKGNRRNDLISPEYREVQITCELYNLIQDFIQINDGLKNQKYLFNYDIYNSYAINPQSNRKNVLETFRDNLGGTGRFYSLLNNFYKEIVEEKFKYKVISVNEDKANLSNSEIYIEKIRPGDTRHFAICNLYLQGFNPLTIARLAGHDTLYMQLNYANHLNSFADSHVKVLADRIRINRSLGSDSNNSNIRDIYKKSLFFNKNEDMQAREVENGYCTDKEFPNNCSIGQCGSCQYYVLDFKNNKNIGKILEADLAHHDIDIKKQIEIIKKIIKSSDLNRTDLKMNKNINVLEQQELGAASKKLQQAITQKAIIESYIFESKKVENCE